MQIIDKVLLLLAFSIFAACTQSEDVKLFTELSVVDTSIDFVNTVETGSDLNIIEYLYFYNGGGVAIGDINNDSLPDVFFSANQKSNRLYINQGDFKFKDITKEAGLEDSLWSTGVTMVDVNADGFLDIYVCNVSGYKNLSGHNKLYINNGDLTFTEKSKKYGLDFAGLSTHAAFFDYDRDGDLDVYLLNHSVHSVGNYGYAERLRGESNELAGDRLYQSQLAQGSNQFIEVSREANILQSPIGYGLGVGVSDINNDGWLDIYVTNDFHEDDYLYINNQDGTFSENRDEYLQHTSRYAMGNDLADVNNDGLVDIFATDMLPYEPDILLKSAGEDRQEVYDIKLTYGYDHQLARNTFQLQRANGKFSEIALFTNTFASDWSWAPLLADLDNDGYSDIFITNGIYKRPNDLDYIQYISNLGDVRYRVVQDSIEKAMIAKMPTLKIPNRVYKNNGDLNFIEVSEEWGLNSSSYSNGAAYSDLDLDGDLDLVINNINQPAFIYKNNVPKSDSTNYIKLSFHGGDFNPNGIGAKVVVYAGDLKRTVFNTVSKGFMSSVDNTISIGLGHHKKVDSLEILWPEGIKQKIYDLSVNGWHSLKKPSESGLREEITIENNYFNLVSLAGLEIEHKENDYNDYNLEYLIPYKLSTQGPTVSIGDINNDGREDLFIGSSKGEIAKVYYQNIDGQFNLSKQSAFENVKEQEEVDSKLIDLDNDNDLDLILVSGGHQASPESDDLKDRVYINNEGVFKPANFSLGGNFNSSSIATGDFNDDGFTDFAISSDAELGNYGLSSTLRIFENSENGIKLFKSFRSDKFGLIKSIDWFDYDNDGDLDLVIAGHWMPILIYINDKGSFDKNIEIASSNGLWNVVKAVDLDNDGDLDLVAGNIGLNNKFHISEERPLKLHLGDYDNNQTLDPIITYPVGNRYIPLLSKDELSKQLPILNKKYTTYAEYGENVSSIKDLFSIEINGIERKVFSLSSSIFLNEGGQFIQKPLPKEVQFYPINDLMFLDVNNDNFKDIIIGGNNLNTRIALGRYDAGGADLLLNKKDGNFSYIPSGFDIEGQVNDLVSISVLNNHFIIFAINNDSLRVFEFKNIGYEQ